jgi:predicted SAM-dependent methyltransferase
MKLHLGNGSIYREGWVNLDYDSGYKTNMDFNLDNFPYPFEDNTFDEVYSNHVFEHLDNPYKSIKELHRICKDNATITIVCPHFSGVSWCDLTHKKPYCYYSFNGPSPYMENLFKIKSEIIFGKYYNFFRFNIFANAHPYLYEKYLWHWFPAWHVKFILVVKK